MKYTTIWLTGRRVPGLVLATGLAAFAASPSDAQTFNLTYSFTGGSDGGVPLAGLAIDSAGNLYGTASAGGASGAGVVFEVNASGQEQVLYSFTGGADGGHPQDSLLVDSEGRLYGTTYWGGANGHGTVFVVDAGGEKVLYSFAGGSNGANPVAGLIEDAAGKLYGTTFYGGAYGGGTVFEIAKSGEEKVLYSFGQGSDGANPIAGVTFSPKGSGALYGTTSAGGSAGAGTVFQLTPSKAGWTEQILYNFQLQDDGGAPYAGVVFDGPGRLYGAATTGGAGGDSGGGTVFRMTHGSAGWNFKVIYEIPGWGLSGTFRNLLMDASGNIYGTTHCDGDYSMGTVYELSPSGDSWISTSLYVFANGGSDGYYVFSNLIFDSQGNLHGTASAGGAYASGVVWQLTP